MKQKKYYTYSIEDYLDKIAAGVPAPGGGSVAALSAALGAGLLEMVCQFTLKNKKYKKAHTQVKTMISDIKKIRKKLTNLIDKDARIYEKFSKASKPQKQNLLKTMAAIPFEICCFCVTLIQYARKLTKIGNKNLIIDALVGSQLLNAGFNSSAMNIKTNIKYISDKKFVGDIEKKLALQQKKFTNSLRGLKL